jgi:hypothetical protein
VIGDNACAQQCQDGGSEPELHLSVPHRTTLHLSPIWPKETGPELMDVV